MRPDVLRLDDDALRALEAEAGRKVTIRGYHEWALARSKAGSRVPLSGAIRVRLIGPRAAFVSWYELIAHVRCGQLSRHAWRHGAERLRTLPRGFRVP